MSATQRPGTDAVAAHGWVAAHRWLLLRRASQLAILTLFLIGPWFGIWWVKGTLSSSLSFELLPLTDPFLLLQILFTTHVPEMTAVTGALIVLAFYLLVGGRVYCSWVCPVNIVTDAAHWLRERMGIRGSAHLSRSTRYWILGLTLVLALLTGSLAWELINPVSLLHRGLVFGMGMVWAVVLAIFLLDLVVSRRAWCGHLCPMGAFYGLVGHYSPLRVSAARRAQCDDCMDCFAVCPEPQVIKPALKGEAKGIGPVIRSGNCTNCGRCIDVCAKDVFNFTFSMHNNINSTSNESLSQKTEVLP